MSSIPTVSDSKRLFYSAHPRPINTLYRRVVEELLVEMHLLSVNGSFRYDAVYALGVVTVFDTFMAGYEPTADVDSIFTALCRSIQTEPEQFRRDSQQLVDVVRQSDATAVLTSLTTADGQAPQPLQQILSDIGARPDFKYSRLFGVGLFTLLETLDPERVKDAEQLKTTVEQISGHYHLPADKLLKDLALYRSNIEKMAQARITMEEAIAAERKKRDQREQEKAAAATGSTEPAAEAATPSDPA